MHSQIQRITGIEFSFESQSRFIHFEYLAILLIILVNASPTRTGVCVCDNIKYTILVLEKAYVSIRVIIISTFLESQVEPTMFLIKCILYVEEHLLFMPINHPTKFHFLVVEKDIV